MAALSRTKKMPRLKDMMIGGGPPKEAGRQPWERQYAAAMAWVNGAKH